MEPDGEDVLGVQVLAHGADLPITDHDQHMVLLVVDAAVLELAVRFNFNCNAW